ncbi:MAG: hypothetical protein R2695_21375 [Acidimicrobiales bacterium]
MESVGGIHPSGATFATPSSPARTAVTTAVARSSMCRYCTGGSPSAATPTRAECSSRASCPRSSSVTTAVGRSTATATPGWRWPHSAATRSTSARTIAQLKSGLGRTGAPSVSGIGFAAHAP